MATARAIGDRIDMLRTRCLPRSRAMDNIKAVREGRWDVVAPGMFPEEWNGAPLVSNMVDVAARDFADNLGPLPTIQCKSANMATDAAKKFADKRTKIARYIVDCSNLQDQQHDAANRLVSYAFYAYIGEPDFEEKMSKVRVSDNHKAYYQLDRWGRYTKQYVEILMCRVSRLQAEFPECYHQLAKLLPIGRDDREVEVAHWYDDDEQVMLVLEQRIELMRMKNVTDRCPVRVVELGKLGEDPRGYFDDVIPVQIARGLMNLYLMEATEKSVYAPLALPDDVQELNYGPDAQLRSATPEKIGKVPLPIPNGLFGNMQLLEREQRIGSRYPEGRTGNMDQSIVTGQGVEALMGAWNDGIKSAQQMMAQGLQDILSLCLEMDEKLWPNLKKTVTGDDYGSPYEVTYIPSRDIKGDYSVKVTYGLTAGLDPNRALIFVLQSLQAGLISRRTAMEQVPVDINITEEEKQADVEMLRASLGQSIAGLAQAIPMLASQGQDPAEIVRQINETIRLRQKGESIEEAIAKVFVPPPPPPEAGPTDGGMAPPPGGPPQGGMPSEMMPGQGSPEELLMQLTNGMNAAGNPNLSVSTKREVPL